MAETADEISQVSDGEVVHVQGDLTDADDIANLISTAASESDSIDHLVTSTGGPGAGPFAEWDDDWYLAYDLLVMSVVRLCREAYPHLKADGGGSSSTPRLDA